MTNFDFRWFWKKVEKKLAYALYQNSFISAGSVKVHKNAIHFLSLCSHESAICTKRMVADSQVQTSLRNTFCKLDWKKDDWLAKIIYIRIFSHKLTLSKQEPPFQNGSYALPAEVLFKRFIFNFYFPYFKIVLIIYLV